MTMDNGQIYDFVNTILRKEKNGSAISPERFTLMLISSMWEKVNYEFSRFEITQVVTDTIKSLKVPEETIAISASGTFDLTTLAEDYLHPTTLTYVDTSTRTRQIDICTDAEWAEYTSNSLLAPDLLFPIAKIAGDTLFTTPIVSVNAELTYLKKPTEPFYDYYIDANDEIVYLQEGQVYTLLANESYTEKESPYATFGVGDTIGVKPAQDANNMSVELPFPDQERIDVAYKILQKLGIPVQENMAAQFGAAKEQKEEMM